METSIFLAKAWGLYLAITALAFLLNKNNVKALLHYYKDEEVPFFSGFFILLAGLLTVLSHNIWDSTWQSLITLIGWVALLKGIIRLFSPETVVKVTRQLRNSPWTTPMLFASLILGIYLAINGFVHG